MGNNRDDDKDNMNVQDMQLDSEKGTIEVVEKEVSTMMDDIPALGTQERVLAEKRLVRKLDLRLLPTVVVVYVMNYIDRSAITTARLQGMQEDLGINDVQYATVLAILYVTYCPAQIPSNMLLNYLARPSLYIGACVVAWGITSTLTGITTSWGGILACRMLIGLPEAAFYPGSIYLLSGWYTKRELGFRTAILFSGLLLSNAFGSLMAAGILADMEGIRGIRAWRWLFFIEGAITIFVGLNSMWLLPDNTHNTRWLSNFELRLAQARLSDDAGEADRDTKEDSPWIGLKMAVKDPLVLMFAIMSFVQLSGLSFQNFFPTLTETLGFDTTVTLLLAAPPWVFATVICCVNAWHMDRSRDRFFHIASWWWGVILACIVSLLTTSVAGRYVSLFLMASGLASYSVTLAWMSSVVSRPPAKRAAAIGIVNAVGNLGTFVGAYIWKSDWAPGYHPSMIISLAALVLSSGLALVIRQILVRKNRKLDADEKVAMEGANSARVEDAARVEGITFEQAMERRRKFRYLY